MRDPEHSDSSATDLESALRAAQSPEGDGLADALSAAVDAAVDEALMLAIAEAWAVLAAERQPPPAPPDPVELVFAAAGSTPAGELFVAAPVLPLLPAEPVTPAMAAVHRIPAEALAAERSPTYSLREASVVLASFALFALLLDAPGLLTWAQRIEVGRGQQLALSVLRPLNDGIQTVGLAAPRRALLALSDGVTSALGSGEDPLLASGWTDAALAPAAPPAEEAPADLALLDLVLSPNEDSLEAEPELAPPAEAIPAGSAVTVLLIGDSMIAGSLGTELNKQFAKDARLKVVSAFQTATGLSRPDVYDWMRVVPQLLEREHPRLVIASFGANDATNILEGDATLEFNTTEWRRAYARRVMAMMRALAGDDTRVLWLGLPPMRDERFARRTSSLNELFSRAARRTPRVEFLELDAVLGQGGDYATFVRGADGKLSRFRLDDGIHYSPAGARAVARWGVDWAKERLTELTQQR